MAPDLQARTACLDALLSINWFSQLGQPLEDPYFLTDLGDWPGPESELVMPLGYWQQELYESFIKDPEGADLEKFFHEVRLKTIEITKKLVPYLEDGDTWEWPNFAVAVASWTAGLVALHQVTQRSVPQDLQVQWDWYQLGRLPLGYVGVNQETVERMKQLYSHGAPAEGYVSLFERHPNHFIVH